MSAVLRAWVLDGQLVLLTGRENMEKHCKVEKGKRGGESGKRCYQAMMVVVCNVDQTMLGAWACCRILAG